MSPYSSGISKMSCIFDYFHHYNMTTKSTPVYPKLRVFLSLKIYILGMIRAYNYLIMRKLRIQSTWQWLLAIFTLASLVETIFYSQMLAFTPLYLPRLGISDEGRILLLVGWITAASPTAWVSLSCRFGARWPIATPASRSSSVRSWYCFWLRCWPISLSLCGCSSFRVPLQDLRSATAD